MATQILVEKRIYFKVQSVVNFESYYIIASATYSEADIKKELERRGYIEIEVRYATIAWP